MEKSLLDQAFAAEEQLLDSEVRADAASVAALLADDFQEIGQSGRLWDREAVIEALREPGQPVIVISERDGRMLADGLVLLTYVSESGGRRARRSSVWEFTASGPRLRFHQGTPLPGAAA